MLWLSVCKITSVANQSLTLEANFHLTLHNEPLCGAFLSELINSGVNLERGSDSGDHRKRIISVTCQTYRRIFSLQDKGRKEGVKKKRCLGFQFSLKL